MVMGVLVQRNLDSVRDGNRSQTLQASDGRGNSLFNGIQEIIELGFEGVPWNHLNGLAGYLGPALLIRAS